MFLQFLLIILINTIFVIASDDESEESKYIDLLPEKEKKEFIEKIARRILAEVTSTEVHKNKSEELTDSQLNAHSAYVARLLKEESDNLRRRIENENKAAKINDAISIDTSPKSNDFYDNDLGKVNQPENQKLTKVIKKTVNVLLDEHNNITTTTENPKTEKEKDAKEQQKQDFGDLEKEANSMKDQENITKDLSLKENQQSQDKQSKDKNQQASINQNDRTDDRGAIDLTLRQKESTYLFLEPTTVKNEMQSSDSQISNAVDNKKETISIEIEITDKKDVLKSGSQIPVKVIYDYGTESKTSVTPSAVEISTSKNNNLEIQTSKHLDESIASIQKNSRRFSLDTQNKTMHHPDSQENGNGEQNIINSEQKNINNIIVNESAKNNSTVVQADNQQDTELKTETTTENDEKLELNSTITIKPEVLQKIMQEALNQETDLENLSHHPETKPDDSKDNPNNAQILGKFKALEDNVKTIQETVPQELDISQKSENEILRKKRTSSVQDMSTETSSTGINEEIEKITDKSTISEATTTANIIQQESSTPESTTFATFTTATESTAITDAKESTTIVDTKESSTIAVTTKNIATIATTSDNITTKKASDTTTSAVTSTRNIEEESPTKIILLESGSNENVTDDNSPNIETTTEEIVKARTVFITGYPDEDTDDETEATPYSIVTEADTDEDSDIDIKELSNTSDISPTTTTEVTESPITTLVINSVTNNATVNEKVVAIEKVLRNSKGELFTSTQITPLTTKELEEQTTEKNTRFFYSEEVVVKNDSVVENKTIRTIKNIVNTISQNALRHDSKKEDRHDKNNRNNEVQRKEYVVFELLPGQNPFQREKRLSGKDPRQYPKLPKLNPRSDLKSKTNNPSQIDHPNYAIVYNYDPKYAYYNPNNRYGPEVEKDDMSINAISNDNNAKSYAVENDNKDSSNSFSSKENWSSGNNEKLYLRSEELSATRSDKIDLDYYFGDGDKNFLRKRISIGCKVTIDDDDSGDDNKGGLGIANVNCPSNEKVVYLNPNVPPNSDDNEHAYNAFTNVNPPDTNYHQTKAILSLLGYSGYRDREHDMNNTTGRPFTGYAPSYTTIYTPPLDLLYGRMRKKEKKQLRSSQTNPQQDKYKVFNRYHMFIDEDPQQSKKNKYRVSSYSGNLNERKPKANDNNFDQSNKFQHPLIILTGNAGRNDQDAKIKTGRFSPLDYFYQDLFAEPEQDKEDHTKLMQKFGELYYDDADDAGKYKTVDRKRKKKEYKSFDHVDSYSAKTKPLKKYPNIDAVKVKTPIKKITKSLLEQLEELYNNKGKTFKVNKKADKKYDKRHDQLEASLNVLKDMIAQENNKALQKYNWLVTAVDIRSALIKLQNLSVTTRQESTHPGHDFVHPKDLQLLKYILYLYIRAISPTEELVQREKSDEYPKNMRFLEDQVPQSRSKRRSLKFLSLKPSDDVPRNMRFLEPEDGNLKVWKEDNLQNNKARAVGDTTWMSTKGLIPKLLELEKFLKNVEIALDELHDAIRHIAEITKYRSQRWYTNLRELYLENPTRKTLLELLLHLTFTRALDIINNGLQHGLQDNHVKFALAYPEEVNQAVEEFQLSVDILNEIEKLSS